MTKPNPNTSMPELSELLDSNPDLARQRPEGALLLKLREALGEKVPPIDRHPGSTLSSAVRKSFTSLPLNQRVSTILSRVFLSEALSKRSTLALGLVFALGVATSLTKPQALGPYLALCVLVPLVWLSGELRSWPDADPGLWRMARLARGVVFNILPGFMFLMFGIAVGLNFASLARFSYSFHGSAMHFLTIGSLGALASGGGFFLAVRPTLRALLERYHSHFLAHLALQLCFALGLTWLSSMTVPNLISNLNSPGILLLGFDITSSNYDSWPLFIGLLIVSFVSAGLLAILPTLPGSQDVSMVRALKRSLLSLLVGCLSIGGFLLICFHLHLTREFHDPEGVAKTLAQARSLQLVQTRIKPEDNAWTLLKPYLIRNPINPDLEEAGKVLNQVYAKQMRRDQKLWPIPLPQTYQQTKQDILDFLPILETAVERPHFSSGAVEGFGVHSKIPNLQTLRGLSLALALFTYVAHDEGNQDLALEYTVLNLKSSGLLQPDVLILLMSRVVISEIARAPVETLILEGQLSDAQLTELAIVLKEQRLSPDLLKQAMLGEMVLFEDVLERLLAGDRELRDEMMLGGSDRNFPWNILLTSSSYLESERKAYFNHQLPQIEEWAKLSFSGSGMDFQEPNPLNLATFTFVPNFTRGRAKFLKLLSQHAALEIQAALELAYRDRGEYPVTLQELVPWYLDELPEDFAQPEPLGLKPGFIYYRQGSDSYQLISSSELYRHLGLPKSQRYGPKDRVR